jgi:hypothetical protein
MITSPRTRGNHHPLSRMMNRRTVLLFFVITVIVYEVTTLLMVEKLFTKTTTSDTRSTTLSPPSSPIKNYVYSSSYAASTVTPKTESREKTTHRPTTQGTIHNVTTAYHYRPGSTRARAMLNSTLRQGGIGGGGTDTGVGKITTKFLEERPPMWDVLDDLDHGVPTAGQFLLDFAIIGNGKCGTTSLLRWLSHHPEIFCPEREILKLSFKTVEEFIKTLYKEIPTDGIWQVSSSPSLLTSSLPQVEHRSNATIPSKTSAELVIEPVIHRRGYKNPVEIRIPRSIQALATHFPQTILFVGIRHPISWFQSLYNFKVQNLPKSKPATYWGHPNDLMKKCGGPFDINCVGTYKGLFHLYLAYLGKTNQTAQLQQQYPSVWNERIVTMIPNPVFLFDVQQLNDAMTYKVLSKNTTTTTTTLRVGVDHTNDINDYDDDSSTRQQKRGAQFRQDVQTILQLEYPLGPPPRMIPGKKWDDSNLQRKRDEQKIDICQDEFIPLRTHLLEISRQASVWIRTSGFLNAPTVHVSSRDYFVDEILGRQWMIDPCTNSSNITNVG